jgi:sec-independent protein translocase protein TatA
MAFDDPVVWILILAVVIFLFGANKIPQFAKAIGQAKREFDQASKEITNPASGIFNAQPTSSAASSPFAVPSASAAQSTLSNTPSSDPLFLAAQQEGIDTQGKTRDQIATEIAWKLKSK